MPLINNCCEFGKNKLKDLADDGHEEKQNLNKKISLLHFKRYKLKENHWKNL